MVPQLLLGSLLLLLLPLIVPRLIRIRLLLLLLLLLVAISLVLIALPRLLNWRVLVLLLNWRVLPRPRLLLVTARLVVLAGGCSCSRCPAVKHQQVAGVTPADAIDILRGRQRRLCLLPLLLLVVLVIGVVIGVVVLPQAKA